MEQHGQSQDSSLLKTIGLAAGLPWFELIGELWKIGCKIMRGLASEGIYEVLDYECRVELKDKEGKHATIRKRENVRYLQDYITAYQDQAWGHGQIFLNYKCFPGIPVDEYQLGHNTFKLISLRQSMNKGDLDEFHIEWSMRSGFLKSTGFWGTSINHKTKKITVKVVFPKDRPPLSASVYERNLQRTRILGLDSQGTLADGRHVIIWENSNPRLYEDYILKWEW